MPESEKQNKNAPAANPPAVTDLPHRDISELMNPGRGRRQNLNGFQEDYVDIVDYIVRCTHRIWEERGVGRIYDHYGHNVIIHTSDGTTHGRDKVISDSIRTMNAFADLRLYADDVIWTGDDETGFHSSHRIFWTGRNTGPTLYGPATGKRVQRYGVAHCLVRQNRVVEEWICRDELALVRQLGYDPIETARRVVERSTDSGRPAPVVGEPERLRGQMEPDLTSEVIDEEDVEGLVRRNFHEIWNWRLLNRIQDFYAPELLTWAPPYRKIYGRSDYRAWVVSWLAGFSDLTLTPAHVCWLGDPEKGFRVATRWRLQGTHDGPGPWGEPTGKPIFLLGITHQEIRKGRIVQEWNCFDEFALLKQLVG